jgi:predicted MFS family arabinose efflux permease
MTAAVDGVRRRGLLRRPAFRRLWLAGLVTETGDWLLLIALPVFVLQLTGSALVTSTVFLLELVPTLAFGPIAGVLADRWDRRRTLVGVSLAQAALLLPLLAVDGRGDLWIVYAVTVAESALATLNEPVRMALLPALVPADDLVAANGLTGLASNLARLAGGALGGVLLAVGGLGGVVLADAVTFGVAAALLASRAGAGRPARDGRPAAAGAEPTEARECGLLRPLLDGLAVIRGDRRLRGTLSVFALMSLAQGAFVVLFVLFVVRSLDGGAAEVGLLRGVQAIGGIIGGLLVGVLARRLAPSTLVGLSLIGFGVVDAAIWNGPALASALALYVGLFIAAGVPGIASVAGLTSLIQTLTPDRYRARVISAHVAVFGALQALGMLVAGLLSDTVGLLVLLNAQAALYVLAGLVALRMLAAPRPIAATVRAGTA